MEYIATESRHLSSERRFITAIRQQCSKLAGLPTMIGRPRPELQPDLRSVPFRGYIIFFRYERNTFEVVSVLEGHRDIDAFFRQDPTGDDPP